MIEPLTSPTPPAPEVGEGRWSEGVCGDGAAILFDGVMIPIEKVVQALNRAPTAPPAPAVVPVAAELQQAHETCRSLNTKGSYCPDNEICWMDGLPCSRYENPTAIPLPQAREVPNV